ncbi:MAG: hypothetical protein N4A45_10430 [Flavobacteriales bacterium]|jgi:hypothetical protein|nr:hypothetical protein [Flavobacteriales bacterium]
MELNNEKIAINCETEEEARVFINECGCEFESGIEGIYWGVYESRTCYNVEASSLLYSPKSFYEKEGYQIIPYKFWKLKEGDKVFIREDLKDGEWYGDFYWHKSQIKGCFIEIEHKNLLDIFYKDHHYTPEMIDWEKTLQNQIPREVIYKGDWYELIGYYEGSKNPYVLKDKTNVLVAVSKIEEIEEIETMTKEEAERKFKIKIV